MKTKYSSSFTHIKLGTHTSVDDLRRALAASGCRIGKWEGDILDKITVSPAETEVDLVVVTAADLYFKDRAPRINIYERAMEPVIDADGYRGIFRVGHGHGEHWLDGNFGNPFNLWHSFHSWVFLRRK